MARNPALDNACRIINDKVDMPRLGWSDGMRDTIIDLAEAVGMKDDILTHPLTVAAEITLYLDDMVKNP